LGDPPIGSTFLDPILQQELAAQPFFRGFTYRLSDGDPICGWLAAFLETSRLTVEDLHRLDPAPQADDVVFLHSGQAAQLRGFAGWLEARPDLRRAVIEFGVEPGLDLQRTDAGMNVETRDPRFDPRAVLNRLAANEMTEGVSARLRLSTFDSAASQLYEFLLRKPVATLPVPRCRVIASRPRLGRRPITVAVLGHQRWEKGYHLVPAVFEGLRLLFPGDDLRLLAHNGAVGTHAPEREALRRMAVLDSRCTLEERIADQRVWTDLLARSDLILCPYEAARFTASYSAVVCEATANGIPVVVPADTALARMAFDYGAGIVFSEWTVESVLIATAQAFRQFDALVMRAEAGAERWALEHGAARTVDGILRLAGVT
jgi:hypothetical protein